MPRRSVSGPADVPDTSFRAVLAGRRGRLLIGLLLAEFAGAAQGIAYSTVLPLAAAELDGTNLYGATLAASMLSTILVLAVGSRLSTALGARPLLLIATIVLVAGVLMSALAPSMIWVLVGSVLRGLAAGLLAAFGLSAIGGLFPDAVRPRVLALYALIWLLPSFVGPALNAAIAVAWGWRWTMAWPAVLIIGARLLVARDAELIPWSSSGARIDRLGGIVVVVALGAAIAGSAAPATWWSVAGVGLACLVAALAAVRTLRVLGHGVRLRLLVVFAGLCAAFFGGAGVVTVAVIDALGHGVTAGAIAYGAGLIAWSVTGLTHAPWPRAIAVGLALVAAGLAGEALLMTEPLPAAPTLVLAVLAFAVSGLGMGLAYPRLSSGAFDDLVPERVTSMAAAVAYAEIVGTAVGSLLGGGAYAMTVTAGGSPSTGVATGFGLSALLGTVCWLSWRGRRDAG